MIAGSPARPARRPLPHQCASCRRHWALRLVEHPAGVVVRCRYCGAVRRAEPALRAASSG